jgi:hypothetical protein
VESDFDGGDDRITVRVSESWALTWLELSSSDSENKSDKIEYEDWERYVFPRRGSIRNIFTREGIACNRRDVNSLALNEI